MNKKNSGMRISVAQFQAKDGDKKYNLSVIDKLTERARSGGADLITFHEMSITAYTHTKNLGLNDISELAEDIPGGESSKKLTEISDNYHMPVLAGLLEKANGKIYNTYICAYNGRIMAKHRKLHPFINKHISPGNEYVVFDLLGWKCGILTCYDNNVIENVRATVLLGAELIFAPHVTCCTPSTFPGSGYVDDKLWKNRHKDPVSLRKEFDGPKGKEGNLFLLPEQSFKKRFLFSFTFHHTISLFFIPGFYTEQAVEKSSYPPLPEGITFQE
ncbi:MAG: nitrilase-related carbon-nitrogen hydrolase [Bacteroidota bacterium]